MESQKESEIAPHREEEEEQTELEDEEEEESESEERPLVLKTTKVVEYLEPLMGVELLGKFPDNSAYDFDYSRSTIWSPLVPRPYRSMDLELTPTKLSFMGSKVGSKRRKKFATTAFNLNLDLIKKHNKNKNKNKNKKMVSDLSPTPPRIKPFTACNCNCNPIIKKGWIKALKAASKQFKRWKARRDPIAHVMLPKSLSDGDF